MYLHKDHLGSIDTITTADGTVKQKLSYDAWGQRRATGSYDLNVSVNHASSLTQFLINSGREVNTNRGFTGHEHIDEAGLIHMNGRIYDPRLARFMSAEVLVKLGFNTKSGKMINYPYKLSRRR